MTRHRACRCGCGPRRRVGVARTCCCAADALSIRRREWTPSVMCSCATDASSRVEAASARRICYGLPRNRAGDRLAGFRLQLFTAGPLRVVDLSSLWAGPLCGALLARAGCDVVKVESVARPGAAKCMAFDVQMAR